MSLLSRILSKVVGYTADKVKDATEDMVIRKATDYVIDSIVTFTVYKTIEKSYNYYFGDNGCVCPGNAIPECIFFESGGIKSLKCADPDDHWW